jgi:hypothetical protein
MCPHLLQSFQNLWPTRIDVSDTVIEFDIAALCNALEYRRHMAGSATRSALKGKDVPDEYVHLVQKKYTPINQKRFPKRESYH